MADSIISKVKVEGLFGLYSYSLPVNGAFSTAAILYGDNGVGKSTILRMVFHLLSTSNSNGHRTALTEYEFSLLRVELSNGVSILAQKLFPEHPYLLTLSIERDDTTRVWWEHVLSDERDRYYRSRRSTEIRNINLMGIASSRPIRKFKQLSADKFNENIPNGNEVFLEELEKYVPTMFILNADRRLDSDAVADPGDEIEFRQHMYYHEPNNLRDLVVRSREIALTQAMSSASKWFSQRAVKATNKGSTNVHSVYKGVISQLQATSSTTDNRKDQESVSELSENIQAIGLRTKELAEYELTTPLDVEDFTKAISKTSSRIALAVDLLTPYVESLQGRLDALKPIYETIDTFVRTVNSFLNDKTISFKTSEGFRITNRIGSELGAGQLSSGEQQLLLLFCYVVTGRDKPSVFMIDEPEISLNIKWQRKLVQSLLDVTGSAKVQFVFASHSMELLSQHENLVVQLDME